MNLYTSLKTAQQLAKQFRSAQCQSVICVRLAILLFIMLAVDDALKMQNLRATHTYVLLTYASSSTPRTSTDRNERKTLDQLTGHNETVNERGWNTDL